MQGLRMLRLALMIPFKGHYLQLDFSARSANFRRAN